MKGTSTGGAGIEKLILGIQGRRYTGIQGRKRGKGREISDFRHQITDYRLQKAFSC